MKKTDCFGCCGGRDCRSAGLLPYVPFWASIVSTVRLLPAFFSVGMPGVEVMNM